MQQGDKMHDKNGTEIKAGDTLFNPHDRDQYHIAWHGWRCKGQSAPQSNADARWQQRVFRAALVTRPKWPHIAENEGR
jgi:hypothetical protein